MEEKLEKSGDRTYDRVVKFIKEGIQSGTFQIGSRLPPERILAEQLNVSRNSVREAFKILEITGTVTSTQGAGHFVSGNFAGFLSETLSMMFLLHELTFPQISQLRYALEKQAFALAVDNADAQDRQELQTIIDHLDHETREEENVLLDKQLHYTIAKASKNVLFVEILNALSDVMDRFIADLRMDIMSEALRRKKLMEAHRRIVEAIQKGEPSDGFAAIDEHFALIDTCIEIRSQGEALPK